MKIREAQNSDLDSWVKLRCALWPECRLEALREEATAVHGSPDQVCFLLIGPSDTAVGFVEGAVHPGADTPYAHVEGWFVVPEVRGRGHGQELIGVLEQWCLHRAIYRLTSDTTPDYPLSPKAHARAGFRQIRQFTLFLKELQPSTGVDSPER